MKKLLIICILMVSILFISGCTDKSIDLKTSTDSQVNEKSDTQTPDLVIKPSDVPSLTLYKYEFLAIPKSTSYNFGDGSETGRAAPGMKMYKDVLPIGTRNVGQHSEWTSKSGKLLAVTILKYDSNSGNEFIKGILDNFAKNYEQVKNQGFNAGNPNIGDYSFYSYNEKPQDVITVSLIFTHGNYYSIIQVKDETDKSLNEAIRIAKIVNSRLD